MKQYIDKSAIVAEIERRIKKYASIDVCHIEHLEALYGAKCKALMEILSFLDTLEVKDELVVDGEVYQTIGDHVAWDCRVRSSRFTDKSLKLGDKVKLIIIKGE